MAHRSGEILSRLPLGAVIGAEVGVFAGVTSARLLAREDLTLYMVDPWDTFVADGIVIATKEQQEKNYNNALEITNFAEGRRNIIKKHSKEAAETIVPKSLDFAFIDGDHSYDAVSADIQHWLPKIKEGGLLCGHDYANTDYQFGREVKRAVDDVVKLHGWVLDIGGDFTWFIRV